MLSYNSKLASATEANIAGIERELGKRLPTAYRHFLIADGGGYRPDPSAFTIPGEGSCSIKTFYGISEETSFDLRHAIRMTHTYRVGYLPIATDFFGNRIVIGLTLLRRGKIYWCDHELRIDGSERKPILVSRDFEDFIEGLKPSTF